MTVAYSVRIREVPIRSTARAIDIFDISSIKNNLRILQWRPNQ
ncbi:hypothetical protein X975_00887, partial [Stegodyphus mimosarum]